MKDSLQLLKDLLSGRNWDAAILTADHLLADGELATNQRAYCYYAKCRSLSNLDRYGAALEPGQVAIMLASDGNDSELLGRGLIEVSWVQNKLQMYEEAVATLERFLANLPRFAETLTPLVVDVYLYLGANMRAMGLHEQAFKHFYTAWKEAIARAKLDPRTMFGDKAEKARSMAVWEALQVNDLLAVNEMLPHGERYVRDNPNDKRAKAMHYLDVAKKHALQGDDPTALGWTLEALSQAEKHPELLAAGLLLLYDYFNKQHDVPNSLAVGLVALKAAEVAERHEMMAEITDRLTTLFLVQPEAVLSAMAETLRTQAE